MTYRLTRDDFERVVDREFAFLRDAGFGGAAVERRDDGFLAGFDRADLGVRVHCDLDCEDMMTVVARPLLGRELLLETIHALNVGDSRYPSGGGGSWRSLEAFEERLALEATLLRENLPAAAGNDALYEEASDRA